MATAAVPQAAAAANPIPATPADEQERDIRLARDLARLKAAGEGLFADPLDAVLLYGLMDRSDQPAIGILRALRTDLAGFARLAIVASEASAVDLLSLSEHIGEPLEGFVRRIDVVLEVLERSERGRKARRARKKHARAA